MLESQVGVIGDLKWVVYKGKKASLGWKVRNMVRWDYFQGWLAAKVFGPLANLFGIATIMAELRAVHMAADGTTTDYGMLGRLKVTTAYCEFMIDQHIVEDDSQTIGNEDVFSFHDSGVGAAGDEEITDTDIQTTDGVARTDGTHVEGSSVQLVSVGTIVYTSTLAIVEHGLFSRITSGTLMDRTEFAIINVVNTDSIQYTYTLTYTAGG